MGTRQQWIDAARGVALSGVVFHHALLLTLTGVAAPPSWLVSADLVLDGFRMPTLVAISGMLAVGVREWPWRDVWRRRIGPLLVLYAVWSVVGIAVATLLTSELTLVDAVQRLMWLPLRPEGWTWYLVALPLYIAAARAFRRVPTFVILPVAALVFLGALATWPSGEAMPMAKWWWPAENWVYFVCAERFASAYRGLAERATHVRAASALVGFGAVGWAVVAADVVTEPIVIGVLSVLGTLAALTCAGAWGTARWLAWARAIGTRSLGVYAVHGWLAFVLWHVVVDRVPAFRSDGLVVPVGFAVAVLAMSYGTTVAIGRFAPVPLLRPWWSTKAREPQVLAAPAE